MNDIEMQGIAHGFDELQRQIELWVQKQPFGKDQHSYEPLIGANEEICELAQIAELVIGLTARMGPINHAHLKIVQGIRGSPAEHEAKARDAIADLLIFISGYCNRMNWKISDCLRATLPDVLARDWGKYPKNGVTE